MTSFDNQAQVRRESTAVAGTSSLLIGVRRGEVVRELSWPLEHLSLVVGAILILDLLGHGLRLVHGVGDAHQVAPGNAVQGMAGGTDLAVDLVAAPDAARARAVSLGRVEGRDGRYLAWSNESSRPWCDHGYAAGCSPASASPLACASPTKGSAPYRCVYHATEPTVAADAPSSAAREFKNDCDHIERAYSHLRRGPARTWNADEDEDAEEA